MKKGFLIKFNIDVKGTCFCVASPFLLPCVQRSWTTLAGVSPVTVIASEPCS